VHRDFAKDHPTGENHCVNEHVAYALIDAELRRLQQLFFSVLSALFAKVETKEHVGEDARQP
jgi:hypothetical protein